MSVQFQVDVSQIQPSTGQPDPIPQGMYSVIADETEMKPTAAANGDFYLKTRFSVIEGPYAGRKIYTMFNLKNQNPEAQKIAWADLSAFMRAIGLLNINNTGELHNKPLKIKVGLQPAKGEYAASNNVKGYYNINEASTAPAPGGSPSPFAQPAPGPAPAPAPTVAPAAPWEAAPQITAPAAATAPAQQPWEQTPGAAAAQSAAPPWQQ